MMTRVLEGEFEDQMRCGKSVQNEFVKNVDGKKESRRKGIFHQQNDMKDMISRRIVGEY